MDGRRAGMIGTARPSGERAMAEVDYGAGIAIRPATAADRFVLAAILFLSLALRLYRLDFQSLWGDEAYSVRAAREPLDRLLIMLAGGEPHPPLYYWLLHVWRNLAGESDFAIRLLSVLFGVLAVAAVYALGRRLFGPRAALAAALLTAASPFQVWYAQETRMYAMLVALTACSALLFYDALTRGGRLRWSLYVAATALAMYTQYFALFVVLFENVLVALLWLRSRHSVRGWLGSQIALLALFFPWLYFIQNLLRLWANRELVGWPWMPPPDFPTILARTFGAHTLGTSFPAESFAPTAVALGVWAALALVVLAIRHRTSALFVALYALVPVAGAWLLGELVGRSVFHERFLIVASPAFYLLLGYGLGWRGFRLPLSLLGIAGVLALGSLSLQNHYFDWHYHKDDLRGLARYVDAHAREGDIVVTSITRQWLYQRYATVPVPLYVIPPGVAPAEVGARLAQAVAGYQRVWYLPYARSEVDLAVDRWLAENAYPADQRWFNTARLALAGLASPVPPENRPVDFSDRVHLDGYGVTRHDLVPGDVVGVALSWRPGPRAGGEAKASLRLLDGRGHVYAQIDPRLGAAPRSAGMPGEAVREHFGLLVPVDTPPGDYRLELRLYDAASGRDLLPVDSRGPLAGGSLILSTIHVDRPPVPASPAALDVTRPADVAFGTVARLAGYAMPSGTWQAGDRVSITLQWQALQPDGRDYRPVLRLLDAGGREAARRTTPASDLALPVERWRPGDLIRQIQDWRLPPGLPGGAYTVALALESPEGAAVPLPAGGTQTVLGQVAVAARPGFTPPAPPDHPTNYTLGDFVRLAGFDTSAPTLHPGETLRLTLHWQVLAETEESYKVFTHLLSPDNRVLGQHDGVPCDGGCPTSAWAEGDAIADQYALTLSSAAPPGVYRLEVGMYRPFDDRRLTVVDAAGQTIGDHVILGEVTVP